MKNYKLTEYEVPKSWYESLFIGNGRMGAAISAGVSEEVIYLNEETVWGSKAGGKANPKMPEKFAAIRKLFLDGKPAEAEALARESLADCYTRICSYEFAGKLLITLHDNDSVRNYKNELDIVSGLATISYDKDGSHYVRESFASYPDDVVAYRVTSSSAPLNLFISYERELTLSQNAQGNEICAIAETVSGDHKFATKVKVVTDGNVTCEGENLRVTDTCEAVIYVSVATEFNHGENFENAIKFPIKSYTELKATHIADFSEIMSRADIDLPYDTCSRKLSINERRRRLDCNIPKDEELLIYAWQMARYTLVCSSRPGTLPANLQAIWSNHIISPWSCDYHTNINIQENYWGAEVANLSDCHLPLFDYMNNFLLESGKETAKVGYNARGTVVHHLSDIYGFTSPADGLWGIWPHGASWLSYHMWEHYLFTNDKEFLKNTAYEFIHQSAIFFLDTMVEDNNGQLLFGPSMSPENFYWTTNEKGERVRCVLTMSSAMDTQIIDGLLRIYADASKILGIDNDDVRAATKARKKLPPQKVGKFGQIMEWMEDYEENEVAHRHISPAFAMYPDNAINRKTPELYNAIDVTLTRRITGKSDGGGPSSILDMGLTLVWIIALYARLRRGEECGAYSNALYSKLNNRFLYVYPGTDIFQVDATLGFLGAFSEMFIQSHEDVISLIPAIPKKWDYGSFYGLRARGGFEVSVKWKDCEVVEFTVIAEKISDCVIELPDPQKTMKFEDEKGNVYTAENGLIPLSNVSKLTLKAI